MITNTIRQIKGYNKAHLHSESKYLKQSTCSSIW